MKKKEREMIKNKIVSEEDYIYNPRTNNSLNELLKKYPKGVSDDKISKVLLLSKEELNNKYNKIIKKLRNLIS